MNKSVANLLKWIHQQERSSILEASARLKQKTDNDDGDDPGKFSLFYSIITIIIICVPLFLLGSSVLFDV